MVIKIHQVASTENALRYNEKKVKEGVATFFDSKNTLSVNPFKGLLRNKLDRAGDVNLCDNKAKNTGIALAMARLFNAVSV